MATYIKTLKEDNGDITYPQTKAEGVLLNNGSDLETELSQYVTAEEIGSTAGVTPAITTAMIADDAITDDKIDWATLAPYWKTVATSTSSSVTLPAGYRFYRVCLIGQKTSTNTWGVLQCPQATGTTWIYIQGMSAGTWIAAERSVTASSDKAIMDGARGSTPSGLQTWDITILRAGVAGTDLTATWQTSTTGSLTYNTGRSIFNVTSGAADLTLNSELSSAFWSVEVLVED